MNTDRKLLVSVNSMLAVSSVLGLCLLLLLAGTAHAQNNSGATKRLDLNKATAEELDTLPEVGPKLAKAIVAFREKSGPYRRVEDLLAVPGISKRRLEKIRPHVYVANAKKQSEAKLRNQPRRSLSASSSARLRSG
jgi:competence ComEA-like helix-hairpin-helix protein